MPLRDIKGQDRAIEILKNCVKEKKIAHAYLFLGPDGSGKRRTAVEFVKFLNCHNKKDDSCGSCPSCTKADKSMHPDIAVVLREEERAQIPIAAIRELGRKLSLKPFEEGYKTAIIVDAEDMSEEAANSLLKMLEEPEGDTVFMLTASNPRALADTIVSRCQVIRFKPLTKDVVEQILIEDFDTDKSQAKFLSAISGADISKALSLKEEDAISWKNDIIDDFSKNNTLDAEADILAEKRQAQKDAMDILIGFYRDVLIYKFTNSTDLIINIDRLDLIKEVSKKSDPAQIERFIRDIAKTRESLNANANSKLAIRLLQEKLAV